MVSTEQAEFAELFTSLLRDHAFYSGQTPVPARGTLRYEYLLNGSCHLWLDLPNPARAEQGRLTVFRYQDELRRYALELMERVGDVSLPKDLSMMARSDVHAHYMNWIGLMLVFASVPHGDG